MAFNGTHDASRHCTSRLTWCVVSYPWCRQFSGTGPVPGPHYANTVDKQIARQFLSMGLSRAKQKVLSKENEQDEPNQREGGKQ